MDCSNSEVFSPKNVLFNLLVISSATLSSSTQTLNYPTQVELSEISPIKEFLSCENKGNFLSSSSIEFNQKQNLSSTGVDIENDFIINLPPKKKYRVEVSVVKTSKAKPNVIVDVEF